MSSMGEKFEDRLRKARLDKGLSQSELAARSGLQPSAVSHFETGTRAPSFENLKRLSDALGVSIDFLLGRQTESSAAGPVAQKLFRNFEKMTPADQETIAAMAEMLRRRYEENREKHED